MDKYFTKLMQQTAKNSNEYIAIEITKGKENNSV
jgi:hypothetical protein